MIGKDWITYLKRESLPGEAAPSKLPGELYYWTLDICSLSMNCMYTVTYPSVIDCNSG